MAWVLETLGAGKPWALKMLGAGISQQMQKRPRHSAPIEQREVVAPCPFSEHKPGCGNSPPVAPSLAVATPCQLHQALVLPSSPCAVRTACCAAAAAAARPHRKARPNATHDSQGPPDACGHACCKSSILFPVEERL
eukprot:366384-Chlamydomonas_euryale.AAC.11